MAKNVGSACAQIVVLVILAIFCSASAESNRDSYEIVGAKLPSLHTYGVVPLTTDQLHRQRRELRAESVDRLKSVLKFRGDDDHPGADVKAGVAAGAGAVAAAAETNVTTLTVDGSVSYNVHNVGVNGTGQRKAYTTQTSGNVAPAADTNSTNPVNVAPKKATLLAQSGYPKKTPSTIAVTNTDRSPAVIDVDVSKVDISEDEINQAAEKEHLVRSVENHEYYNSMLYVNKEEVSSLWEKIKTMPPNSLLSSSHRRAMTVELKFDFPFYGHYIRNITVATGGFLYTGEYVHSWLAATQYIAPLMANFDTSMSNDSFVRVQDNGTAFIVVWENVTLQDKPEIGNFTFSVTLHQNGDIDFAYLGVPMNIKSIDDKTHPVKVGLSDAYIIDKQLVIVHRKTIYEYHRVTFQHSEISNFTMIKMTAQPTCLGFNDCNSCINHNTTFTCLWCSALNRCSTGTDRKKNEWLQKGCDAAAINTSSFCPALGEKGNNAAAQAKNGAANSGAAGSSTSPTTAATGSSTPVTEPTVVSTRTPHATAQAKPTSNASSDVHTDSKVGNAELSQAGADNKNVGVAFGFMVPICLVFAVTLWLFYAYRNPHTKSGQLLIQFRPSQWSWRRGEARYTAATIHM
ncbi:plexin domain-containing protein 2 isoform X2 [Drosophila eugracilis]|uniref:plexin domain-containing protein 2 isoform X2 n=1 Tax=Drosophila eugracilis TaxID=29029 RepID=UPI0007E76EC0|nr:plexin domain-containing protein 2 isoform X2 [Drosophila eugracilis]